MLDLPSVPTSILIQEICNREESLSDEERGELREKLFHVVAEEGGTLRDEVLGEARELVKVLKEARRAGGRTSRDTRELVQSGTQLLTLLTRFEKDLAAQERFERLQETTVELLGGWGPEVRDRFVARLREKLQGV